MESFAGRVRDELLSVELFSSLAEAQVLIEDWRQDYNALCRRRHNRFYADVRVMPMWVEIAGGASLFVVVRSA